MSELYDSDPILRNWVNPYYLKPETIDHIRESSISKPYLSYAILDNFFNEHVLDDFIEKHKKLEFRADDIGLPYDSFAVYGEKENSLGSELFYHKPWHELLAEYVDTPLEFPGEKTGIKLRAHAGDSKGFWIHTDRTKQNHSALAALIYLNKNWKETEGAMLQLWAENNPDKPIERVDYSLEDYSNKRLDFLNERYNLTIDLPTSAGLKAAELFLIDQITPEYNRIVITDFVRDPAYHSISPSNGRIRYAVVQWLY